MSTIQSGFSLASPAGIFPVLQVRPTCLVCTPASHCISNGLQTLSRTIQARTSEGLSTYVRLSHTRLNSYTHSCIMNNTLLTNANLTKELLNPGIKLSFVYSLSVCCKIRSELTNVIVVYFTVSYLDMCFTLKCAFLSVKECSVLLWSVEFSRIS